MIARKDRGKRIIKISIIIFSLLKPEKSITLKVRIVKEILKA
jgi:hypothetical protein